jgi:hypothetical protein
LIDDSSAQGGDKGNRCVGEDNSNMCKDVVIETEIDASQVENDFHEDVKLQSELRNTLDVIINEHENVEMPSQSDVKSIVGYVELGESRIFKNTLVSQLNENPTLS